MRKTILRKRSNGRLWLGKMQFSTISGSSKGPSTVGAVALHTTAFATLLNTVVLHIKSTMIKNAVVLPYCKQCAHLCSTIGGPPGTSVCVQQYVPLCSKAHCHAIEHHLVHNITAHCEQCSHLCSTLCTSRNMLDTKS